MVSGLPSPGARRSGEHADPLRIVHVIHTGDVGGVQTIVAGLAASVPDDVDYRTAVFVPVAGDEVEAFVPDIVGSGLNRPSSFLRLLRTIRRNRPDVLVCSLWRSVLLGSVAKLLDRRLTLVVFLHNAAYTQPLDRLAHALGLRLADAVFSDSEATARALLPADRAGGVIEPPMPVVQEQAEPTQLRLVFWGRLAAQKRIDRALEVLTHLRELGTNATLTLIGPNGGEEAELRRRARDLGVESAVVWHPAVSRQELWPLVREAAFFVQLSDFEGRALSVIEAMRWGIVPVVTPVGEIPSFCTHLQDAVVVDDLSQAAATIAAIWPDRARWETLSANAVQRWSRAESGADDFFRLCRSAADDAAA